MLYDGFDVDVVWELSATAQRTDPSLHIYLVLCCKQAP